MLSGLLIAILSPITGIVVARVIAGEILQALQGKPKAPGLSSQAAQIKPLTAEQIALGKKPYLGPKRPRPVRKPKRLR